MSIPRLTDTARDALLDAHNEWTLRNDGLAIERAKMKSYL